MSRTAALSRYLAAVDEPVPYDDDSFTPRSRQSSIEESSRPSKSQQPADDKDVSRRHEVVVAPSSLGMSVRDVVSSRNTLPDGRPRSRSAGRAPMRSSRDMVQDIYSRMGVDYTTSGPTSRTGSSGDAVSSERSSRSHAPQRARSGETPSQEQSTGAPSSSVHNADKFQKRYRAAAVLSASPRGRNPEPGTPERRSRSLGRRWPPGRSVQTAGEPASTKAPTRAPILDMSSSPPSPPTRNDAPISPIGQRNYGGNTGSVSPRWQGNASAPSNSTQPRETQDDTEDKTETGDSVEKDEMRDEMPPPGSVKERLSVYSSSSKTKNSRNFPKTYPVNYSAKRDHPPKIDIYEEIRRAEDAERSLHDADGTENDSSAGPAPLPSLNSPSPAAADAASEPMVLRTGGGGKVVPAYSNKSQSGASMKSPKSPRKGSSSNVAGAFLAAINKSPQPVNSGKTKKNHNGAPVTEVATTDELGTGVDGSSVLSALSGDEFAQSPRAGHRDGGFVAKSRPSWSERNKLASYQKTNNPTNHFGQSNSNMKTTASVDKLVDERVQAHVKEVETRMEKRMLILESQLEQQMKARMDYMEAKIDARMDELQSMMSMMINGHSSDHHEI